MRWITAAVPTAWMSSATWRLDLGVFETSDATIRLPADRVVDSLIERSWPIASGLIDSGKTTVSRRGRTGSSDGISGSWPASLLERLALLGLLAHPAAVTTATYSVTGCCSGFASSGSRTVRSPGRTTASARLPSTSPPTRDQALERPVVELDLLVVHRLRRRPAADARNRQDAVRDREVDLRRIDAGEVADDRDRRWVVRAEDVGRRTEGAAAPRHRASPAQIREELLHLALQPLAVATVLTWPS